MKSLTLLLLFLPFQHSVRQVPLNAPQSTLVILAHPDDETTIGPVLAKYAKQDKVILVVATDGRYGTRIRKIPEDSLIAIRQAECECSCSKLGIEPPVMLGRHDGFGINTGIGEYFRQTAQTKQLLRSLIDSLKPTRILSFGPDGDSGHPDHRIIGSIVTELILREGWYDRYPLFFLGWTKEQAGKFGIEELNYLDKKYFTTPVKFSDEEEEQFFESIRCYQSQNTQQEIEEWIAAEKKDRENVAYFRKFFVEMKKVGF